MTPTILMHLKQEMEAMLGNAKKRMKELTDAIRLAERNAKDEKHWERRLSMSSTSTSDQFNHAASSSASSATAAAAAAAHLHHPSSPFYTSASPASTNFSQPVPSHPPNPSHLLRRQSMSAQIASPAHVPSRFDASASTVLQRDNIDNINHLNDVIGDVDDVNRKRKRIAESEEDTSAVDQANAISSSGTTALFHHDHLTSRPTSANQNKVRRHIK